MTTVLHTFPRVCLNQADASSELYRSVEVHGLPDDFLAELRAAPPTLQQWQQLLSLFVVQDADGPGADSLPMWGSYRVEQDVLRFLPRYPLLAGQRYCARLNLGTPRDTFFELPRTPSAPPQVLRIYPSANVLPENLLRFYVYFSQPMREEQALARIRLYEQVAAESERLVEGVFLDSLEELWDTTHTRLTLILDPARVKSGLVAHAELGRALHPGRRYRIEIGAGWPDIHGEPLRAPYSKSFRVGSAQIAPPVLARPQLPAAQTRDPLTLCFAAPMDHVLLAAFLTVRAPDGRPLTGEISLAGEETLCQFRPTAPWTSGRHTLEVNSRLEDIAGNNLQGRFDKPVSEALLPDKVLTLAFEL